MRGCQRRMVVAFWLLAVRAVVRNSPFLTNITANKSRPRPRLTTLQGSDETICFVAALFVWGNKLGPNWPRPQPQSASPPAPIGLTPSPSPRGRGEWYALCITLCYSQTGLDLENHKCIVNKQKSFFSSA